MQNNNNTDYNPEIIGICPICKKGKIIKNSIGYSCNYFVNMNDKCTFNIYKEYWGKETTVEIAKQLIENGETEIFNDFIKKRETDTQEPEYFSASLIIEQGIIKPRFKNKELKYPCPICGEKVEELLTGYACKNYLVKDESENRACIVFIAKKIAEKTITIETAETLLESKRTPFLKGFLNNNGEPFETCLVMDEIGKINFDNKVCKCPKCGGDIFLGKKAYNCKNYTNETIKCNFVVWREMQGRTINPAEVKELCENGVTPSLSGFKSSEGEYSKVLVLTDDFKVKMT